MSWLFLLHIVLLLESRGSAGSSTLKEYPPQHTHNTWWQKPIRAQPIKMQFSWIKYIQAKKAASLWLILSRVPLLSNTCLTFVPYVSSDPHPHHPVLMMLIRLWRKALLAYSLLHQPSFHCCNKIMGATNLKRGKVPRCGGLSPWVFGSVAFGPLVRQQITTE